MYHHLNIIICDEVLEELMKMEVLSAQNQFQNQFGVLGSSKVNGKFEKNVPKTSPQKKNVQFDFNSWQFNLQLTERKFQFCCQVNFLEKCFTHTLLQLLHTERKNSRFNVLLFCIRTVLQQPSHNFPSCVGGVHKTYEHQYMDD